MTRYEISVWNNITGDVVRKLWDADQNELDAICHQYDDEPGHEVVIDEEWEEIDE